jgi:DNA polymerase gamma 1
VFNYGRIYGAGVTFAIKLLMQFNPEMTEQEARKKANDLYKNTKGYKCLEKIDNKEEKTDHEEVDENNRESESSTVAKKSVWKYGSESEMFNKLEEIARSEYPTTPVLKARITSSLEPRYVNDDVSYLIIKFAEN